MKLLYNVLSNFKFGCHFSVLGLTFKSVLLCFIHLKIIINGAPDGQNFGSEIILLNLCKNIWCDPHLNYLDETVQIKMVQMRGHNIWLHKRLGKIIPKLSSDILSTLELCKVRTPNFGPFLVYGYYLPMSLPFNKRSTLNPIAFRTAKTP